MYVRAGSSTADPADSHVQIRTAPQTRRQKHLGAGFTGTGNDGDGTVQPDPPRAPGMLRHATGLAGPVHPPSTPDEPSCTSCRPALPGNAETPGTGPTGILTYGDDRQRQAARVAAQYAAARISASVR